MTPEAKLKLLQCFVCILFTLSQHGSAWKISPEPKKWLLEEDDVPMQIAILQVYLIFGQNQIS